jgi:putative phosphoribosyl transferase
VKDATVIVVDDGVATGSTIKAGIRALRRLEPARIVVAVPVAPRETIDQLEQMADEVHCLATPAPFMAVGAWYRDFGQTTDDEVRTLLDRAGRRTAGT